MTKLRLLLLAAAAAALPQAPAAADVGAAPRAVQAAKPKVLNEAERSAYRAVFAAIRAGDWTSANAQLDAMRDGPLHAIARAEIYLAKDSPEARLEQLLPLLDASRDMPKAEQLGRLAERRGAVALPALPPAQALVWQGGQPRRARARSVSDPLAAELERLIQPLIVADQPSEAEATLLGYRDRLTAEARSEWEQRVAWSYYLIGRDADARRVADAARSGPGEWAVHAAWVSGLASWRAGDCNAAADAFATVGARASDTELLAAGNYWASRADMLCKRPERVQARLRQAAAHKETFYGLLAASRLGLRAPQHVGVHDFRDSEWREVATKPNVRAAIALTEIGETALAEECLKHQARIGGARDHEAMVHLAADLNLPYTQFWLAHHAPRGARLNFGARYPLPAWQPAGGWRVDQALVYAHALQESNFRTGAVSPAGAVGLMQVLPGTARQMANSGRNAALPAQLTEPAANMEFGQSYMEYLRSLPGTGGLLPKVIAAYNAGPKPIADWNYRGFDRGDPLLWIESLPYWETRGYVPIVLRNYWIYEAKSGRSGGSREALAQGMWPRFPGMSGAKAVRIDPPAHGFGTGGSGFGSD